MVMNETDKKAGAAAHPDNKHTEKFSFNTTSGGKKRRGRKSRGRKSRGRRTAHRRSKHHKKHNKKHHRRTKRKVRKGRKGKRGGSVVGTAALPFGLLALQKFFQTRKGRKDLKKMSKTVRKSVRKVRRSI